MKENPELGDVREQNDSRTRPEKRRFRPSVAISIGLPVGFVLVLLKVVLGPASETAVLEPGVSQGARDAAPMDSGRHAEAGGATDGVLTRPAEQARMHDVTRELRNSAALPRDAWVKCSDAENGTPLEAVHAYDSRLRRSVGVSGRDGKLMIESADPGAVVLHGAGYLACLIPEEAREELARTGRAEVRLYQDRYSMPLRVSTELPPGVTGKGKIRVLFRPADGSPEHGSGLPVARFGGSLVASPGLRDAWRKHALLVDLIPVSDVVWHLGRQFGFHELPWQGGIVRFAQTGVYRVRAHDEHGNVAETRSEIRAHADNEIRLRFERGRSLEFLLSGAGSGAVAGARVRLARADRDEDETREMLSDEKGIVKFRGLFPGDRLAVEVTAKGFETLERTLPAGTEQWKLVLRPIPTVEYELTVLEAGSRKPLPGVVAVLGDSVLSEHRTRSNDKGRLWLPLYLGRQNRVELNLRGYLDHVELFQPGFGSTRGSVCHLVPSDLERRCKLGLVCLVEGRLLDAEGLPLRGQMLSLVHEASMFQGLPDGSSLPSRMILNGSRADEVLRAVTDTEGRFRLYSSRTGRATVQWYGHADAARRVVLVNGKRIRVSF